LLAYIIVGEYFLTAISIAGEDGFEMSVEQGEFHVADLRGGMDGWSIRCWAKVEEGAGPADLPPCACVAPCPQCVDALVGPDGAAYSAHGAVHVASGETILAVEPGACVLSYGLRAGGWADVLHAEHGDGVYLVGLGLSADGELVGVSPRELVDLPEDF